MQFSTHKLSGLRKSIERPIFVWVSNGSNGSNALISIKSE